MKYFLENSGKNYKSEKNIIKNGVYFLRQLRSEVNEIE